MCTVIPAASDIVQRTCGNFWEPLSRLGNRIYCEIIRKHFYYFITWWRTYTKQPTSYLAWQNTAPLARDEESWVPLGSGWAPFRIATYRICYPVIFSGSNIPPKDLLTPDAVQDEVCCNLTQCVLLVLSKISVTQ